MWGANKVIMTEEMRNYLKGLKNEDLLNQLISTHVRIEHMFKMRSDTDINSEDYKYYDNEYCYACNDYMEIHNMIVERMRKEEK